mgnify:FL=1
MKKKQSGFALVLSLVLLLVMSLMGGALIVIASSDHSKNTASDRYMQTFYVAETALLEGERYIVNKFKGDWIDGAVRDDNRILPANTGTNWDGNMIEVNYDDGADFFDTDKENAKLCWNSFKDPNRENFQIITAHSNNFGQFFKDSLDASDIEDLKINIDELKKYYYEYFISNIGSAPYRGRGSSVKKTAGDDSTNGIAYRIYGCGIYINDVNDSNTKKFIVPLESVVILPK